MIVISINSLLMVNNSTFFVLFKAVKRRFDSVAFGEYCKSVCLHF